MKNLIPKISVVMSVYNRPEYAKTAVESILNQTFSNFELIIFDNGSTDNTAEIIENFAINDDRIVFIKNSKNINYTLNLIKGFELAKGEYIARMDDDDISMPERLERQSEYLDKHPEIAVLGTFINTFGDAAAKSWVNISDPDEIEVAMNFFNPICHPTVMIRKSFLKKYDLKYNVKELYAEDYCLWKDVILCGGKIANLPIKLLNYRCHKKSSTLSSKTAKIQDKSAERTRLILLKRFYNSSKETRKARRSVWKCPFLTNKKKKISNILEIMKTHTEILPLSGIEKFEKHYLGEETVIDVFFASGNDFAPHLATAITSILKNSLNSETYRFYILDGGISQENKEKLNKCQKIKPFDIEYIKVDLSLFKNCPQTPDSRIPKQTYYRYIIPWLKPNLEKCIYLDSDIVVEDSLKELWNINLEDNYVAAVEELYDGAPLDAKRLNVDTIFNAGVILINIKKWIEDDISNLLFKNTTDLKEREILKWQDQDVMNYTFKNKVKFISPRFNLQWNTNIAENYTQYTEDDIQDAQIYPIIIHFNSCLKPWDKKCKHPQWKRYYHYLKFSPFNNGYTKYVINKIIREFRNIFYRKKQNKDMIKIKVLGLPVLKIEKKGFYKEKRILGLKYSSTFLTEEFLKVNIKNIKKVNEQTDFVSEKN